MATEGKKIRVWLMETSEPIDYERVVNTYTKGRLYCLYLDSGTVVKYPLCNIFRVEEEYGTHGLR